MTSILFVCEDNATYSQIAECICKFLGNRSVTCDSAGLKKGTINPDVIEMLKAEYDMDISKTQFVKEIAELKKTYDIVIAINTKFVAESSYVENWELTTTKLDAVISELEAKIMMLLHEIKLGNIQ